MNIDDRSKTYLYICSWICKALEIFWLRGPLLVWLESNRACDTPSFVGTVPKTMTQCSYSPCDRKEMSTGFIGYELHKSQEWGYYMILPCSWENDDKQTNLGFPISRQIEMCTNWCVVMALLPKNTSTKSDLHYEGLIILPVYRFRHRFISSYCCKRMYMYYIVYMEVSWNRDTPKSSIYRWIFKKKTNHPFVDGTPPFFLILHEFRHTQKPYSWLYNLIVICFTYCFGLFLCWGP